VQIKQADLQRIATGEVDLVFRDWKRPTVRAGGTLRTSIGVLAIDAVEKVDPSALTDDDARRAGRASLAGLLAEIARYGGDSLYRVEVHRAGDDPRIALRERSDLTDADVDALLARLDRFDRAGRHGPWTRTVLQLIADQPGVRAPDLAASLGRDTASFKIDVRKLKELGLTISLEVGYHLSPRGEALLSRLPAT
jgi:integrase